MSEQHDAEQQGADEEVLELQPGHVMPREHYERLAAEAAEGKAERK